jgi:hypothetical protein
LLFSIGFRGGVELNHSGFSSAVFLTAGLAVFMAFLVPVYAFFILRLKLDTPNAAAIAAAYGSVSAVAFITAQSYLEALKVPYSGHMVAALALMESPAIVVGVLFARLGAKRAAVNARGEGGVPEKTDWAHIGRDAFLNGSVFILMGAVMVGALTGTRGESRMAPFVNGLFPGALALFLLDMGIVAARRLGDLRSLGWFPPVFAIVVPAINAALGFALTRVAGFSPGDSVLFMSLCFGASYIAVPAAMRMAVPEANPSLYVTMALAITFPVHIVFGIPLFAQLAGVVAP